MKKLKNKGYSPLSFLPKSQPINTPVLTAKIVQTSVGKVDAVLKVSATIPKSAIIKTARPPNESDTSPKATSFLEVNLSYQFTFLFSSVTIIFKYYEVIFKVMGKLYDLERRIEELEVFKELLTQFKKEYDKFKKSVGSEIKINPEVVKQLPNKEGK